MVDFIQFPWTMFDLKKDWSISFAGCGFMGIYYVGATGCILERFPRFVEDASKIYGSSAGALMAAALTTGTPLGKTRVPHRPIRINKSAKHPTAME